MKKMKKRIISLMMAFIMVFSLFVGTGNLSASDDSKGESGADKDTLLGATPTDADPVADENEDTEEETTTEETEDSIIGTVTFYKETPSAATENNNMAGIQYGIYKDADCSDLIDTIVLSYDGHVYRDGERDKVYRNRDERGFSDSEISNHEFQLELPVSTYYYRIKSNLKDSSLDFSSTGYVYADRIGSFELTADNSPLTVKIRDDWDVVSTDTTEEIKGEATELTSEDSSENTTEDVDPDSESTTEITEDSSEVTFEDTEGTTENVTEDTESTTETTTEATEQLNPDDFFEVATPDVASASDAGNGYAFVGSVPFSIKTLFAPLLMATSSNYYVRRTTDSFYSPKMFLQDSSGKDLYSVYCGDHNKNAANYKTSGTPGDPINSLKIYGETSGNPVANIGKEVAKTLYYGYLEKRSWSEIRQNLDWYRHKGGSGHFSSYAFDVSSKSMPTNEYNAKVSFGKVNLTKGTVSNIALSDPRKKDISPAGSSDEHRYLYSYSTSLNMKEDSGVLNLSDSYYSVLGLNKSNKYKRTTIYKTITNANTYKFNVPSNVYCFTTQDNAEKGINKCTWEKHTSTDANPVTLKSGTYFMFVTDSGNSKTSSISAKASLYGFVAVEAVPSNDSIQNLFGAELYDYSVSINIDWELQPGSAKMELQKVALIKDNGVSKEVTSWDYDTYNMAGIYYTIYSTDGKAVKGSDHTRDDKITSKGTKQIVLSYNGKAYMNGKGENIVFVSPEAKNDYQNSGNSLYTFRWYQDELANDTKYYCQESSKTIGSNNSEAVYYNPGGKYTTVINSIAGKDVESVTGFKVNDKKYNFTMVMDKDKVTLVTITASDETKPSWGKFSLVKKSSIPAATTDPNYYNMAGIKYGIYNGDTEAATTVSADAHTRADGISVKPSNRLVLSFDGKAYMDDKGKNVVFVSKAAKAYYTGTENRKLYTYRWYKHDIYEDTTYYYHESSHLLDSSDNGVAYYYNGGNSFTSQINSISGKAITVTGYKQDTGYHGFTIVANGSNGSDDNDIQYETEDNFTTGKGKAKKNYSGSASELKGIEFKLYKVANGDVNTDPTKGELIGTFIHDGTRVVPLNVETQRYDVEIGTGNDFDCFVNLPFGWYRLVEDNKTSTTRGFSPVQSTPLEIKTVGQTIEFTLTNVRTGLKLNKQFDKTPMNKLCSYSLEGAEYKAYIVSGNKVVSNSNYIATFTTDSDGKGYVTDYAKNKNYSLTDTKSGRSYKLRGVPLNSWVYITETKTSEGCGKADDQWMQLTADNMEATFTSTEPLENDPIMISIKKEDSTSGKKAGAASLAGAEFTVKYYDVDVSGSNLDKDKVYSQVKNMAPERTWVYKTDEDGMLIMSDESYLIANKSDSLYLDKTGKPVFPYGAITIEETKAPDGYTRTGAFVTTDGKDKSNSDGLIFAIINKDYTTEKFIGTNSLIKKEVNLRGDIKFKKIALDTNKPLSGIAFKITSKTTGESHIVVTDENGMIDTSAIKHSDNTNAADKDNKTVSGTWFYGNDEEEKKIDDSLGALPYDVYEIEEVSTDVNKEYRLITPITVDLTEESSYTDGYQLYDLGTVTNIPEPYLGTRALGVKTQDNVIPANEKVDVEDICDYYYLETEKTYTMKGVIKDPKTGKAYKQPDGTYSLGHKVFTTGADDTGYISAEVRTPFVLDTTGLDAKDVVVAEYLFEGEDDTDLTINEDGTVDETGVYQTHTGILVKHDDLTAKSQTLSIPKIGTTALGVETETHYLHASGIQKFKDIVDYTNVVPDRTYDLEAVVMDQESGKPILDVDGNIVTATAQFTPKDKNGSAEVIFTCDLSKVDFRDKATVLFEDLYYNKVRLAVHKDLNDTNQQLFFPEVTSTLLNTNTGEHKALYSKNMDFTDTLNLSKIPTNEELTVKEVLVNARTKKPLKADGKEITSVKKQTFESKKASISMPFTFDATKTDILAKDGTLADIVAYVYVYDSKGNLIASEEDLTNKDQTITIYTENTKLSVEKVWDDNEDQDGIRPTVIKVQLYADGKAVGRTVELSENNDWKYTWNNLDKQKDGEDIEYTVDEVEVPDGYVKTVTNDGAAFIITNTHTPGTTLVKVTKVWADNNDKYQTRPKTIEVQLYKGEGEDKEKVGDPVILDSGMNWKYTWSNLEKTENSKNIVYSVDEVSVPSGYKKSVSKDGDAQVTSYTITNSKNPGPKTGDAFKMIPIVLLMGASLIAIIVLLIMRKKKR